MASHPNQRVLLVEDEPCLREVLQLALEGAGFHCAAVDGLAAAQAALVQGAFDGVLSDLKLKDGSGLDLLTWMKSQALPTPVVIMTAYATTETTVEALNLGAVDFITKPFRHEDLIATLKGLLSTAAPVDAPLADLGELVGAGPLMRRVNALIGKVSRADTTVLITGESGTGKDVVARLIHRHSERAGGPFVPINCGALPEALLESELFGFERGAFTGAHAMKRGLFEEAGGGVLFLDEIGELPRPLQVKLLRVLQERRFRRLGATEEHPVDLRVIAATNRDLQAQVAAGAFREDLYYRLNILRIHLPPLRQRLEDLPVLAAHFIQRACAKLGRPSMALHPDALALLEVHAFPGNVRELENLMERCVALNPGGPITRELLPEEVGRPGPEGGGVPRLPAEGFDLEAWLQALRAHFLGRALEAEAGVKARAARRLGMSFRAYRYWLAEQGGAERLPKALPRPQDFPAGGADGPLEPKAGTEHDWA